MTAVRYNRVYEDERDGGPEASTCSTTCAELPPLLGVGARA